VTRYQTHVYLVSDQATPNLTPALDPDIRPERAVLAVTPQAEHQARWLTTVLERHGVHCERLSLDDAYDLDSLRQSFRSYLQRCTEPVAVNVSGGSKPMSIAAFEVFAHADQGVFYVNPRTDTLDWLHPTGIPAQAIADRVGLEDFLEAHGASVHHLSRQAAPASRLALYEEIVRLRGRWKKHGSIGLLNRYAQGARETLRSEEISPEHQRLLNELPGLFAEQGLLSWEGTRLVFPDEQARRLVNGVWLEEYLFSRLLALKDSLPAMQDLAANVVVRRNTDNGYVQNELDVALLLDNRLWVLECKASNTFAPQNRVDQATRQSLYKLEALLTPLGGILARGMLVNVLPIGVNDQRRIDNNPRLCALTYRDFDDLDRHLHARLAAQ